MTEDSGWPKCESCGEKEYEEVFVPECRAEICKKDLDSLKLQNDEYRTALKEIFEMSPAGSTKWEIASIAFKHAPNETRPIDYRALLKKYVEHVGDCEGVTFIDDCGSIDGVASFSEEEKTELRAINKETKKY